MKARLALVVAVVVAVVAFWLLRRKEEAPAPVAPVANHATKPVPVADAPLGTLTVVVKDASGPIANANVRIDELVRTTNASGTASAALPAGDYAVSASADGHLPAMRKIALPAGGGLVELVLAVGGRALTGKVTDAGGGAIANARIEAVKLGGNAKADGAIATAVTGADGTYKLTAPIGPLLVGASHDDYAPQSRYVDGPTADFALVPGGAIEGIVRDARSKQPIAKAKVVARRDDPTLALAEPAAHAVVARDDGTFRITGLRPGAYELAVPGMTREPTRVGLGVAEQLTGIEILVDPSVPSVRGIVRDEHDAPVAHAKVATLGRRGGEAISGDDGTFVLGGLPAGRHLLRASDATHVADRPTPIELAAKDVTGVVVRVRGGARIAGHVEPRQPCAVRLEPDDDALAKGTIPELLAPVDTDDRGEFTLAPVMPGAARLTARCPSGAQGSLALNAPDEKAVLAVSDGAVIAGHVVDGKHAGISGVTVMASPRGDTQRVEVVNGALVSGVQALAGTDGAFELRGLPPGSYGLSVLDRGHPLRMPKPLAAIAVAEHQRVDGVEVLVDRATGVIKGVVTGPDGKPLADAWVSAKQSLADLIDGAMEHGEGSRMVTVQSDDEGGDTELPPVLTDASGRFELTGLPHVKYQVVAEAQAGALRGMASDVLPDATLNLQAKALTSLTGTVRGPNGPAKLFTVELAGPTSQQRSFTDGSFSFQRVDPGDYRVHVTSSEGNADGVVKVEAGHMASLDLVLSANAVVIGRLMSHGAPAAHVPVVLVEDTGDGKLQVSLEGPPPETDDDGRFRLDTKPGKRTLVALISPPFAKRGLVCEAGKTLDLGDVEETPPTPHRTPVN